MQNKCKQKEINHIPPKKAVTFGGVAAVHLNLNMDTSIFT